MTYLYNNNYTTRTPHPHQKSH